MRPLATLILAALLLTAGEAHADRMRLLVPAYQYPTLGTLWADLAAAAPRVPVVAILNPGNGPGDAVDPTYTAAVNALHAAGGKVYGYVYSHYAARGADTVLADAVRFDSFYPLDGFFVDEVTADLDPAHLAYYTGLVGGLRTLAAGRPVMGNPGIDCPAEYVTAVHFDQLVTYEHWNGYDTWAPDPWMGQQHPSRFANLVYAHHGPAAMRAAIALAAARNVENVFVTDDSLDNPWDTTPAYWAEEIATLESTTVTPPASVDGASPASPHLRVLGNPAAGHIVFALPPAARERTLRIFDVAGRVAGEVVVAPGATSTTWSAPGAPAGLYLARLEGAAVATRFVLQR